VREWVHTIPSGLPLWELESLWSPKFLKSDFRGWISLDWKFHYIIEKLLRSGCLKWACLIHLSTYNTSYGRKNGRKLKCQFDSWPLKVGKCLNLGVFRGRDTYCWNALNKGYTFALDLTSIRGLHKKLWASKVARVQFREFQDSCLGSHRENDIWV
jgi:hypothetical protein